MTLGANYSDENELVFASHAGEALAAVHRAIFAGFERNLRFLAAVRADSGVHLALRFRGTFASVTAGLATLRLVYKAFLSVELLLAGSENEFVAALFAN